MNETMEACVALVDTLSPILSLGPRERNIFVEWNNESMCCTGGHTVTHDSMGKKHI